VRAGRRGKDSQPSGKRKRPKLRKEELRDLPAREPDAELVKGGPKTNAWTGVIAGRC
jgi:hypothetical protein